MIFSIDKIPSQPVARIPGWGDNGVRVIEAAGSCLIASYQEVGCHDRPAASVSLLPAVIEHGGERGPAVFDGEAGEWLKLLTITNGETEYRPLMEFKWEGDLEDAIHMGQAAADALAEARYHAGLAYEALDALNAIRRCQPGSNRARRIGAFLRRAAKKWREAQENDFWGPASSGWGATAPPYISPATLEEAATLWASREEFSRQW